MISRAASSSLKMILCVSLSSRDWAEEREREREAFPGVIFYF